MNELLGCVPIYLLLGALVPFGEAEPTRAASQGEPTPIDVIAPAVDFEQKGRMLPLLEEARDRVERFFGRRFEKRITVEVLPDRASFNEYFRRRWNIAEVKTTHLILARPRE